MRRVSASVAACHSVADRRRAERTDPCPPPLLGIDIDQLPPGTSPDPETGAPGRETALASLRSFLRTTVLPVGAYRVGADPNLAQQTAPPLLYPSITHAWTNR